MGKMVAMTGNIAAANAMRQINPDVCAAYPITPSTEVMQQFAQYVADGEVDTELVTAESEHSAMSACIGASAAGGRVMTATSANGLALMWEMLYIGSGNRLPMVMTVVNRALAAPINIHGDHSDAMGARDTGWIQLFCENAQEAYHNLIMAFKIAEDPSVRLPVMVCYDGFIISHSIESMELLEDGQVKAFVGEAILQDPLLDTDNPRTYGPLALQNYYMEHQRAKHEAMKNSGRIIEKVSVEFEETFGYAYNHLKAYKMEDAEVAVVVMGSTAGTCKAVVDQLRDEGVKCGVLKIRTFRPFPEKELLAALKGLKAIAVLDRADSMSGGGGPLFVEVRSALFDIDVPICNFIYGLGGRDTGIDLLKSVYADLKEMAATGNNRSPMVEYLGVRE